MIRAKTLETLEYPAIRDRLADLAATGTGAARCRALLPHGSHGLALEALAETEDAVTCLNRYGELPFTGVQDVAPLVDRAVRGGVLACSDFFRLAAFLRAVERILDALPEVEAGGDLRIHRRARDLESLPGFRRRLEQSIQDEDNLHDRASEALLRIRGRLADAQASIKQALDRVLVRQATALQERIITIRNGRYVVPVRSDRRAAVAGIVHDTSASGGTLFIEPMSVVEQNNRIRELEAAESHEIQVILKELSAIVSNQADSLLANGRILTELDFMTAKARLALELDAVKPELNDQGQIHLIKARHPLIPKDQVVPIDFELGYDFRTLVITGPNTGGKTVSLKTCGLLTLMAMAGLFVPAAAGSVLAWFRQVEADIGDEQSIEQNLSTFSSHMKEIIRITREAGPGTLVLLDELGAGTDPSEGAALAIAILDHLRAAGSHTVATTHYRELKGYAMTEPGVENACCEFDTDTLKPTFKLLIGVPGVSNAFAISGRLGLSADIIDRARSLISEEAGQFEGLVSAIEQSHREAEAMKEEIERLQLETERVRKQLEEERERLEEEGGQILARAREEAAVLLGEARADVEALLEEMRAERATDGSPDHRIRSQARGRLGEIGKKFQLQTERRPGEGTVDAEAVVVGRHYDTISLGVSGIVRDGPDARGLVTLESGSFRVKVPVSELRRAGRKKAEPVRPPKQAPDASSSLRSAIVMRAGSEFMLLGKRVDEALALLDQFLDEAALAGLSSVRIVHGKGTGALRRATHEFLARDRRVRVFRAGGEGEGGDGVTVAELIL